jgi:hypothetical protein
LLGLKINAALHIFQKALRICSPLFEARQPYMFWPAGVTKKNKFRMGRCTADYFGCPLFYCFGKPTKNINAKMLKGVKKKSPTEAGPF